MCIYTVPGYRYVGITGEFCCFCHIYINDDLVFVKHVRKSFDSLIFNRYYCIINIVLFIAFTDPVEMLEYSIVM